MPAGILERASPNDERRGRVEDGSGQKAPFKVNGLSGQHASSDLAARFAAVPIQQHDLRVCVAPVLPHWPQPGILAQKYQLSA